MKKPTRAPVDTATTNRITENYDVKIDARSKKNASPTKPKNRIKEHIGR